MTDSRYHGSFSCHICPVECGADRSITCGACGVGGYAPEALNGRDPRCCAYVARAARHYYEEPPISGTRGSGAIFFSGCNMRCVFCQNFDISREQKGRLIDDNELTDTMLSLMQLGAHNINFVTPSPHVELIVKAITKAKTCGLNIPIVYNTNAYEKAATLKRLEGLVDIYLPDLKYISSVAAKRYSHTENYFEFASKAVLEMHRQCGELVVDDCGIAERGMIIRHLVLPASVDETRGVLDFIKSELPLSTHISLMSQYTPFCAPPPPLDRKLKKREYDRALDYALSLGFTNIYMQGLNSADSSFTPDFDGSFE